jgi:UDP:flavonoid glycosyltransferase YjiC (YdhE family)
LRRRGWAVRLASTVEAQRALGRSAPDLEFVPLGADPRGPRALAELQSQAAASADFLAGSVAIMRWVNALWPVMFDGLTAHVARHPPDIVVADLVTTAAVDAAQQAGVRYVVNNADLLTAISVSILPPAPDVPLLFSKRSISQIGRLDRLLNPARRLLGATVVDLTLGRELNALRRTRGLAPITLTHRLANTLILTDSAFDLEYPRPLPPLLQLVGPMVDGPGSEPPLPDELRQWLDVGPPVVFVNLGTFARPTSPLTRTLAAGLASDRWRALWVLREGQPPLPHDVRVEPWVASQIRVLAHPNVRAFVSHCGINSVHEALVVGTPIVGIPLLADQYDMALRVQDAGVGVLLDKLRFAASDLRRAVDQVVGDERFRRPMPALQRSFRLAGGVERAADLIEHAATFGVGHWRVPQ